MDHAAQVVERLSAHHLAWLKEVDRQIACCLVAGLHDAEIANEVFLERRTVREHRLKLREQLCFAAGLRPNDITLGIGLALHHECCLSAWRHTQ